MDGAENIILMMRMEDKLTLLKIKTWVSRNVIGCLYEMFGGNQVHLVTSNHIRDIVCWKFKITVVHWLVLPVVGMCEYWAIALDVMSPSRYLRLILLNKERFHLWDFPKYLCMHKNKEKLG